MLFWFRDSRSCAQMRVEEVVDAVPCVAENVFAAEIVELARVHHEGDKIAFVFFQSFVNEPDGFEVRDIDVGGAVKDEERMFEAVNV